MSGESNEHRHLGPGGLETLRQELSGRDLAIVRQVAELRMLATSHIKAIHFPSSDHDTELGAARACQRVLNRLVRDRLLVRLGRRLGGVRAGSSGYCYAIGPVGHRLLTQAGTRRRRRYEPTTRFLDHTLAISQLVVDVITASRRGDLELLVSQSEPRCHRQFAGLHGSTVLKPDLFMSVGVGDYEHRWFIEVDRDTESVPVAIRKCRLYEAYYQSGKEQDSTGVFPKVCWVVPHEARADSIREAIAHDRRLSDKLFTVTTTVAALNVCEGVPHDLDH